jgi:hypothetical protein
MCSPRLHKEICKNTSLGPKNQKNIDNNGMKYV